MFIKPQQYVTNLSFGLMPPPEGAAKIRSFSSWILFLPARENRSILVTWLSHFQDLGGLCPRSLRVSILQETHAVRSYFGLQGIRNLS